MNGNHRDIEDLARTAGAGKTWSAPRFAGKIELDARQQALLDEFIAGARSAAVTSTELNQSLLR